MNSVRILSLCKLDNEDIRFIRKQNGFDEETEQLKKTVAQLQEQIKAMRKVIEQQNTKMQAMQNKIEQQDDKIKAIQTMLKQPLELQKNSLTQPKTSVVQQKQFSLSEETSAKSFKFTEERNGTLTITKYIGKDTNVIIPKRINGKNITCIGNSAFEYCSEITTVIIPDGVTYIGDYVFFKCPDLRYITIPKSVNRIGLGAFYGCTYLRYIVFKGRKDLNGANFDKNWMQSCYARIVFEP